MREEQRLSMKQINTSAVLEHGSGVGWYAGFESSGTVSEEQRGRLLLNWTSVSAPVQRGSSQQCRCPSFIVPAATATEPRSFGLSQHEVVVISPAAALSDG